jgi:pyruvate/2-oxoglutarate dehydrogenase complex dihydrolipoamide dehydrogenase (E3) component
LVPARSDASSLQSIALWVREVTLIEKANRILPGREPEAADRVAEELEMRGVNIVRNQQVALDEIRESETGILVRGQDGQIVDAECRTGSHWPKAQLMLAFPGLTMHKRNALGFSHIREADG